MQYTQIYKVADLLRAFGNMSHEHESLVSRGECALLFRFSVGTGRSYSLLVEPSGANESTHHSSPRLASLIRHPCTLTFAGFLSERSVLLSCWRLRDT